MKNLILIEYKEIILKLMSMDLIDNRFIIEDITYWKFYPKLYSVYDSKYNVKFISLKFHNPNPYFIPIKKDNTYDSLINLKIKKDINYISLNFNYRTFWCQYETIIMNEYLRKFLKEYEIGYFDDFEKVPWNERHNYGKLTEIDHCIFTKKDVEKLLLLPNETELILVIESKEIYYLNQTKREGRFLLESEKERHMNKMENRYNLIIANLIEDYNKNFKKRKI